MKSQLTEKDPDAGKDRGQEEKGVTEDEMAGWHHRLSGHESGQIPGHSGEERSLVCRIHEVTNGWTRVSDRWRAALPST